MKWRASNEAARANRAGDARIRDGAEIRRCHRNYIALRSPPLATYTVHYIA